MARIIEKQEILTDLDNRVKDRILEPSNAELLKKLIMSAESLTEAIAIAELGTTYKRTGLHFDKRLEKPSDTIKYFKRNAELSFAEPKDLPKKEVTFFDSEEPQEAITHKLIIGDNYDALLNLLIQYRGTIDVIYIDPPYGKDSMGEFAKTNYENALTRDNLLSMLYPRLVFAKQLLSDSGVIFCSIDEKNEAYIKCLLDDIFEESNYILTCSINKPSEIADALIVKKQEFLLVYAKDKFSLNLVGEEKNVISRGTVGNIDQTQPIVEFPAGLNCINLENGTYKSARQISGSNENITLHNDFIVENGKLKSPVKISARWRASQDMRNFFANNCSPTQAKISGIIEEIYFDGDRLMPYIKKKSQNKIPSMFLGNKKGTVDLEKIFNTQIFDFPKSVELLKWILSFTNENSIILDFFAGSGTTGQAVLELNANDNGKRQFILCTSNETTDTTPNGVVRDVTSKRLKRVMTGKCYDGTNNFEWIKKNKPLGGNLEVYDIATIANFEATENKTPFDVIDETLYGQEPFATVTEKTEWVCDNFEHTQKVVENENDWLKRREGE